MSLACTLHILLLEDMEARDLLWSVRERGAVVLVFTQSFTTALCCCDVHPLFAQPLTPDACWVRSRLSGFAV